MYVEGHRRHANTNEHKLCVIMNTVLHQQRRNKTGRRSVFTVPFCLSWFLWWRGMSMFSTGMPLPPVSGPQSSPCPTPVMQAHGQSSGPKPWSEGQYVSLILFIMPGQYVFLIFFIIPSYLDIIVIIFISYPTVSFSPIFFYLAFMNKGFLGETLL